MFLRKIFVPLVVALGLIFLSACNVVAQRRSRRTNASPFMSVYQSLPSCRKVLALAFSPDGRTLAAGCDDGNIQLWNVANSSLDRTLVANSNNLFQENGAALAFSPDGQLLASGGADNTVRLWRINDGSLLRVMEGRTHYIDREGFSFQIMIRCIAFNSDGTQLASIGNYETKLWSLRDESLSRTFTEATANGAFGGGSSVAFSGDGQLLITDTRDWRISDGSIVRRHQFSGFNTVFNLNRNLVAASELEDMIKLYQLSDGRLLRELRARSRRLDVISPVSVALTPDGNILASAAAAGTRGGSWETLVRIWSVNQGRLLQSELVSSFSVFCSTFNSRGEYFAVGGYNERSGSIRLWRVNR